MKLLTAQVLETYEPTQFKKIKDEKGNDLSPGAIRVRFLGGGSGEEKWAFPLNPNFISVPVYGERVFIFSAPDGNAVNLNDEKFYYSNTINGHTFVNNGILPFIGDKRADTSFFPSTIVKQKEGKVPNQLSFKEKDVVNIQPFQGDIIHQDRFGSVLRFSSTHTDTSFYQNPPFWTGDKNGDPFISLTCGVNESLTNKSISKYYSIETPKDDKSFIYLTSSQKFFKFTLSQNKIGQGVDKLNLYTKPQVIISSDRLVFNSKQDEIILSAKKDVIVSTKNWAAELDKVLTILETLLVSVDNITKGKSPFPTPIGGPTLPNPEAATITKLLNEIKTMKQ